MGLSRRIFSTCRVFEADQEGGSPKTPAVVRSGFTDVFITSINFFTANASKRQFIATVRQPRGQASDSLRSVMRKGGSAAERVGR